MAAMNYKGDWIYCADYEAGDVVRSGGKTYLALRQSAGKDPQDPLNAGFWDTLSGGGGTVPEHNDLDGLQGGTEFERYHLTQAQAEAAEGADAPSAANPFATKNDLPSGLHNDLDGLQGGSPGERYHLSGNASEAAEYAKSPSRNNTFVTEDELPAFTRAISPFSLAETPEEMGMLYGAAAGADSYAAVGDRCAVRAAGSDPLHWTLDEDVPAGYWRDAAFGGMDVYAAVGMEGKSMWRDEDGGWTLNPSLGGDWKKVVWGNGLFVAVCDGMIMKSPDAKVWSLRSMPAGYGRDIAFGNGYFYIVGQNGAKRSADAETWADMDLGVMATWRTVAAGDGYVCVLGGKCVVSSDGGLSFEVREIPIGGWEESCYVSGFFAATDGIDNLMTTEADDIDWDRRAIPNYAVRALSAGDDIIIAAGSRIMAARVNDTGAAIENANAPNATNPFATMQDVMNAINQAIAEATLFWGGNV
jgi:hypothetical protein